MPTADEIRVILKLAPRRYPELENQIIVEGKELTIEYFLAIFENWVTSAQYMKITTNQSDNDRFPRLLFLYAKEVVKERWPIAEPYILLNIAYSYGYARDILKERWPKAEQHIRCDGKYACAYARDVIKGRWPEAERAIARDDAWLTEYTSKVLVKSWFDEC